MRVILTFYPPAAMTLPMALEPIYAQIGELIQARRKKLELKQENLANMLGISRGSLANIETGRQRVLVHQLYRIAEKLELQPADLLPPPKIHEVTDHVDLPFSPRDVNLKARQKMQIAMMFQQGEVVEKPPKKGNYAKDKH